MTDEVTRTKEQGFNGARMLSVGSTPWHKLGRVLDTAPSIDDALKLSGLDWHVVKQPVFHGTELGFPKQVQGKVALTRGDTGEFLSIVSDGYHVFQNNRLFDAIRPLVEKGLATVETAGELFGGKKVWCLLKVQGATGEVKRGDTMCRYLLFTNSHGAGTACVISAVNVRVVCNNTLREALRQKGNFSIPHRSTLPALIEKATEALAVNAESFQKRLELFRHLAGRSVDISVFLNALIPDPAQRPDGTTPSNAKAKAKREEMLEVYETAPGQKEAGLGSAWAALNAATYTADHLGTHDSRGRRVSARKQAERKLSSSGSANRLKVKALEIAVNMANGGVEYVSAPEASNLGISDADIGRSIMADLL